MEFYNYLSNQDIEDKKKVLNQLETHNDKVNITKEISILIEDNEFTENMNKAMYLLPIKDKKIISKYDQEDIDIKIERKLT